MINVILQILDGCSFQHNRLELGLRYTCMSKPKTTDIGEKLDLPDVVVGRGELSQPAVIAVKGSVFS